MWHADLKACAKPHVKAMCRWLSTDVLQWMKSITGYDLDETKLDVFAARYPDKGTLLCHDDRLDGRKVCVCVCVCLYLYLSP